MAIKVAIGGPPHSGKSVLIAILRLLLPQYLYAIVEAAPDGEGITGWSHEAVQELVKVVRHKGKFLPEFVEWVCDSIRNSKAPITFADLGGMLLDAEDNFVEVGVKLTPQNERILSECDYLIVIASAKYAEAVPVWIKEADRLGVRSLAILESVLTGTDDEVFELGVPFKARITRLDRKAPPVGSTTARALASLLEEMAGDAVEIDGSEVADVNFPRLAEDLDLPIHHAGVNRDWAPAVASGLLQLVSATMAGRREVNLWGNCSAGWPYHALACGLAQRVRYYDPKVSMGYVPLPDVQPHGEGRCNLDWRVEKRDEYSLAEYTIPRQIFDVKDLPAVIPPAVTRGKGVVICGKGPWWLTGTLCRSYARAGVAWVAVFTPQESSRVLANGATWSELNPDCGPAVVVASCDPQIPIGTVVSFQLQKI